jgi:hypothetical protein
LYNKRLMFGKSFRAGWALTSALLGALLALSLPSEPPSVRTRPSEPRRTATLAAPADAQKVLEPACSAEIERLLSLPALPGAVVNDGLPRAELLARAKAEPVVFERAPEPGAQLSPLAVQLRRELFASAAPYKTFPRVFARLKQDKALARDVLLTNGYLYAESAELAIVLVNSVMLAQLFRAPELVIQRGAERSAARRRSDGDYEYSDGPELGQRVRLWLFDRVWVKGEEPGPAVHYGVRALRRRLGFDRLKIRHFSGEGVVAELRYGASWVPSVLHAEGGELALGCEEPAPEVRETVAEARSLAARRERVLDRLRSVIHQQVDEALPFDEPKTEEGQQDGKLRPEWRTAYRTGQDRYTFNDDRYFVFDSKGRPRVPQVCIDFITDTLERASGTWWTNRQDGRERVIGRLRFDELGIDNHRSVERFLAFAASRPDWFDVYDLGPEERVPFRDRARFYSELYRHRDRYIEGDIVTILGLRDDEKLHYHSFIVFAADPLTGMAMQVAANAGQPRIRSIENELMNAPKRSILSRVRPRLSWLESVVEVERTAAGDEPPDSRVPG